MLETESLQVFSELGTDMVTYLINKHAQISKEGPCVNIDREVDKIIGQLFYDLLFSVPARAVAVNKMVRELIYLQRDKSNFADQALSKLFGPEFFSLLPYTYSILAGVCSLEIPYEIKYRFINSFALAKMDEHKSFN